MNYLKKMLIALAIPMFFCGPVMLYAAADAESGFLSDYNRLKSDPDYPNSKDWLNPEAKLGHYNAIIIDPVTVRLSPGLIKDGARPDAGTLNQVTEYFHGALTREFKNKNWDVVDAAGDDVTRYRAAITGISTEGGMGANPINYMPAVFVVKTATGGNSKKANIHMESYYSDSVTGQVLAEVMQAATGDSVSGDQITIDNLKEAMDKWAEKAAEVFTKGRDSQR